MIDVAEKAVGNWVFGKQRRLKQAGWDVLVGSVVVLLPQALPHELDLCFPVLGQLIGPNWML